MNVLDLFAGAGGFSSGFEKEGFKIKVAIELEKDMSETLKFNHPNTTIINRNIKNVQTSDILTEIDVVIGGPPCQGFSMAGTRVRRKFINDPRNLLFKEYIRLLKITKPSFFVLENVSGMLSMQNGEIFSSIIKELSKLKVENSKYYISYKVFNTANYGVPQKRMRLVIFGSLINLTINNLQKHKSKPTIWEAIKDLEKIKPQKLVKVRGQIVNAHIKSLHSQTTINKIKNARSNKFVEKGSFFSGAYKVMPKNGQAKTITTRFDAPSAGEYIHPTLNRTITAREAARLQTFSDEYHFLGSLTNVRKMIGNAVPVNFAKAIAKFIKENNV